MASALFSHRGSNLEWGLRTLFQSLSPGLGAKAGALASQVLLHPLVSDSAFADDSLARPLARRSGLTGILERFKLATTIRKSELVDILRQISGGLKKSEAASKADTDVADRIDALLRTVGTAPDQGGSSSPQTGLDLWFDGMMGRVSQRFTMHMRLWTVVFSFLFALLFGFNSINLINELYTNGAFRSTMAGTGQQVTATAITVLDPQSALPAALSSALKQALADAKAPTSLQPPEIQTAVDGVAWIQASVPAEQRAAALSLFDTAATAVSRKIIQDGAQSAAKLINIASKTSFDLLKFQWPPKWWQQLVAGFDFRELMGVLATVGLLSLGAPFWFNALKSMTNLRPVLASKEKEG